MVTIAFRLDGEPTEVIVYYRQYPISSRTSLISMRMRVAGDFMSELDMGEMASHDKQSIENFLRSFVSFRLHASTDVYNLDIVVREDLTGEFFPQSNMKYSSIIPAEAPRVHSKAR